MIAVTYHKDYNKYDLGLEHPLIGDKPEKTKELIEKKFNNREINFFTPKKVTEKDLLKCHSKEYIDKVKELSKRGGMLSFDTPAPKGIFDIASLATGGTILAGKKLFEDFKISANPLGGFHHAGKSSSSGFCFFNDIAVVIEHIREKYKLKRFLIIDLDVHHGNGTQDIYSTDPTVLNISFHQDGRTLYPGTGRLEYIGKDKGEGYTVNLPLPQGTGSIAYIKAFDEIIPKLTKQFRPELIIYQSGVDTHHSDPLADIELSHQSFYRLSKKINNLSKETCDKLLVLLGGGYNSKDCVKSYYNIFCGLLNKKEYIKEIDKSSHQKYEKVLELISELKDVLKSYWDL
jgi:acetoin utilization deacetylase AcuC-like enzyme